MHLDRLIVHTDRESDVLSTITDRLNAPTRQSTITNDDPWDPLLSPVSHSWIMDGHEISYRLLYLNNSYQK